ncbi:hypothetical protein BIFGAL_04158 [Bifidobacterium gallicum DSM 20093 = LMG 11596]|uniref:Uncharacterized protein n=1 Tax=Bifidobacterium gallicum DSM 20093 = LMG 11596 TaxID=561180 RepID=D1NWB1_9BIFI|nr:hypothetical protein BIFGAL_04158 [Bifidobacterium gallicum DSM 20093 = LMG 11596]
MSGKCGFADRLGQGRCTFGSENAVLLTTLVRKDAVWDAKVRFF